MDDFRVGSVPPPDTYGQRRPPEPKNPKPRKRAPSQDSQLKEYLPESFADTIEDVYLPSDPSGES